MSSKPSKAKSPTKKPAKAVSPNGKSAKSKTGVSPKSSAKSKSPPGKAKAPSKSPPKQPSKAKSPSKTTTETPRKSRSGSSTTNTKQRSRRPPSTSSSIPSPPDQRYDTPQRQYNQVPHPQPYLISGHSLFGFPPQPQSAMVSPHFSAQTALQSLQRLPPAPAQPVPPPFGRINSSPLPNSSPLIASQTGTPNTFVNPLPQRSVGVPFGQYCSPAATPQHNATPALQYGNTAPTYANPATAPIHGIPQGTPLQSYNNPAPAAPGSPTSVNIHLHHANPYSKPSPLVQPIGPAPSRTHHYMHGIGGGDQYHGLPAMSIPGSDFQSTLEQDIQQREMLHDQLRRAMREYEGIVQMGRPDFERERAALCALEQLTCQLKAYEEKRRSLDREQFEIHTEQRVGTSYGAERKHSLERRTRELERAELQLERQWHEIERRKHILNGGHAEYSLSRTDRVTSGFSEGSGSPLSSPSRLRASRFDARDVDRQLRPQYDSLDISRIQDSGLEGLRRSLSLNRPLPDRPADRNSAIEEPNQRKMVQSIREARKLISESVEQLQQSVPPVLPLPLPPARFEAATAQPIPLHMQGMEAGIFPVALAAQQAAVIAQQAALKAQEAVATLERNQAATSRRTESSPRKLDIEPLTRRNSDIDWSRKVDSEETRRRSSSDIPTAHQLAVCGPPQRSTRSAPIVNVFELPAEFEASLRPSVAPRRSLTPSACHLIPPSPQSGWASDASDRHSPRGHYHPDSNSASRGGHGAPPRPGPPRSAAFYDCPPPSDVGSFPRHTRAPPPRAVPTTPERERVHAFIPSPELCCGPPPALHSHVYGDPLELERLQRSAKREKRKYLNEQRRLLEKAQQLEIIQKGLEKKERALHKKRKAMKQKKQVDLERKEVRRSMSLEKKELDLIRQREKKLREEIEMAKLENARERLYIDQERERLESGNRPNLREYNSTA